MDTPGESEKGSSKTHSRRSLLKSGVSVLGISVATAGCSSLPRQLQDEFSDGFGSSNETPIADPSIEAATVENAASNIVPVGVPTTISITVENDASATQQATLQLGMEKTDLSRTETVEVPGGGTATVTVAVTPSETGLHRLEIDDSPAVTMIVAPSDARQYRYGAGHSGVVADTGPAEGLEVVETLNFAPDSDDSWQAPVVYDENVLYAPTSEEVVAYNFDSDEVEWRTPTEYPASRHPVVTDNELVISMAGVPSEPDGYAGFAGYSLADGERLWSRVRDSNDVPWASAGMLTTDGELVYALLETHLGPPGGYVPGVAAIDPATGKENWRTDIGNPIEGDNPRFHNNGVAIGPSGDLYLTVELQPENYPTNTTFLLRVDRSTGEILSRINPPVSRAIGTPTITENGVLISGGDEFYVYPFDFEGKMNYRFYYRIDSVVTPIVAGEKVIATTGNNSIVCYSTAGGKLWETSVNASVGGSGISVANNGIYVGSDNGKILRLDYETGEFLWEVNTGNDGFQFDPVVRGNDLFYDSFGGVLRLREAAKQSDGQDQERIQSTVEPGYSAYHLAVAGESVIAAGHGVPIRFDPRTGEKEWELDSEYDEYRSIFVEGETGYLSSADDALAAFDIDTGEELWRASTPGTPVFKSKQTFKDAVLFAWTNDSDESVFAFDTATQEVLWQKSGYRATPVYANDTIVTASNKQVVGLDPSTGDELWSTDSPSIDGFDTPRHRLWRAGDVVVAGSKVGADQCGLDAYDPSSGDRVWSTTFDQDGFGFSTDPDGVYFLIHRMVKFSPVDGSVQWERDLDASSYSTVGDSAVYFEEDTTVYSIDKMSGETNWTFDIANASYAYPAVTSDTVTILDDSILYNLRK